MAPGTFPGGPGGCLQVPTITRNHLLAELMNGFRAHRHRLTRELRRGATVGDRRLALRASGRPGCAAPRDQPRGRRRGRVAHRQRHSWDLDRDARLARREIHFQRAANEAVGTTIRVDLRLAIPQLDISVEGEQSGRCWTREPSSRTPIVKWRPGTHQSAWWKTSTRCWDDWRRAFID